MLRRGPTDNEVQVGTRKQEVLGYSHGRDEGEVLVHHPDAVRVGVARAADDARDVVEDHRPPVGAVIAHHALDEGALPGAVLAEKGVERSWLKREGNVVQRDEGAEALGHPGHLEARRGVIPQRVGARSAKLSAGGASRAPRHGGLARADDGIRQFSTESTPGRLGWEPGSRSSCRP